MHIFYQPDIEKNTLLSEEESKHAHRVLRLKSGDNIVVFDGKGNIYQATLKNRIGKRLEIQLIKKDEFKKDKNFYLHIAIAPTKNINRFEWFLEKSTEIGIDEITPLLCQHSERKVINYERLDKLLVTAMKQSKNPFLPKLNQLTKFDIFIKSFDWNHQYIAHCFGNEAASLKNSYVKGNDALILIGPEGDFSETEVKMALECKYKEINLGPSRLRTETAGVVACHTINLINQ